MLFGFMIIAALNYRKIMGGTLIGIFVGSPLIGISARAGAIFRRGVDGRRRWRRHFFFSSISPACWSRISWW